MFIGWVPNESEPGDSKNHHYLVGEMKEDRSAVGIFVGGGSRINNGYFIARAHLPTFDDPSFATQKTFPKDNGRPDIIFMLQFGSGRKKHYVVSNSVEGIFSESPEKMIIQRMFIDRNALYCTKYMANSCKAVILQTAKIAPSKTVHLGIEI
jgi:hypothetical protein